jgi:hypothetical protein
LEFGCAAWPPPDSGRDFGKRNDDQDERNGLSEPVQSDFFGSGDDDAASGSDCGTGRRRAHARLATATAISKVVKNHGRNAACARVDALVKERHL